MGVRGSSKPQVRTNQKKRKRTSRKDNANSLKGSSTARQRQSARMRRMRAKRNRRILIVAGALAAVLLVAVIAVLAIKNTRKKKAEEQAARAAATDVMDMPFTEGGDADALRGAEASGGDADTLRGTEASGGAESTGDAAATTPDTAAGAHISGIDTFALYRYDEASGMRVKTDRYESAWTRSEDIISLEAFAADTENIVLSAGGGRAWYEAWRAYWQQETGAENCRIGYTVSFDLKNGEHIHAVLLKPGDELAYRPYLENYLYDDAANADAGWYSHLEPGDLSDSMLLTSIKFTPGERVDEIDDVITVTGFVYDSVNDFDYDGNYIGDVAFTTVLENR